MAHLVMFFYIGPEPVDAMVAVWWTLPVEFSFYLLLPLIAWFMRPGKWLFLLGASILLSLVCRLWATSYFADDLYRSFLASVQLPGTLPLFLIGASGAILVKWMLAQNKPKPSWQWADFLFVAGALGVFSWLGLAVLPNMPTTFAGHFISPRKLKSESTPHAIPTSSSGIAGSK